MLGLAGRSERGSTARRPLHAGYGVWLFVRMAFAAPAYLLKSKGEVDPKPADDPSLWAYLGIAGALVLLGGLFAGLTIALMGQDEIYLQVIATSGDSKERKHANRVLKLLNKGKHWVLVTLLLSNVITNETLPIILDRSLGGGWPAVVGSTVLIVIFGEILPQSVCVRYGLPIGAFFATPLYIAMWILSPVAWPTAKLLDYLLGEDHGTTYKKTGLKTLITLHRTLGTTPDERLVKDEVTIINAVLDLKEKSVGHIMTPMEDVFTLSADAILDEELVARILEQGYSRIPIHAVGQESNFVGMLLVKMLITYDPEDCQRVSTLPLATLPETQPTTSCLDIINFFQEGKSHMVLVSNSPGEDSGAIGVVTLEDVIEELIGEEIVDESDIFVDVHKAIRRMHPAPRFHIPRTEIIGAANGGNDGLRMTSRRLSGHTAPTGEAKEEGEPTSGSRRPSLTDGNTVAKLTRRRSSNNAEVLPVKASGALLKEHLKHLGPSNLASRPKTTRINTVKIKPGTAPMATVPEGGKLSSGAMRERARALSLDERADDTDDETTGLLRRPTSSAGETSGLLSAGREASDGVLALGYGTLATSPTSKFRDLPNRLFVSDEHAPRSPSPLATHTKAPSPEPMSPKSQSYSPNSPRGRDQGGAHIEFDLPPSAGADGAGDSQLATVPETKGVSFRDGDGQDEDASSADPATADRPQKFVIRLERTHSQITDAPSDLEDDLSDREASTASQRGDSNSRLRALQQPTRSGSITENIISVGGVKKVILETTSSSEDADAEASAGITSPPAEEEKKYKTHRGTRGGKKHKTAAKKAAQAQREAETETTSTQASSSTGGKEKGPAQQQPATSSTGNAKDPKTKAEKSSQALSSPSTAQQVASPGGEGSDDEDPLASPGVGADGQAKPKKKKKSGAAKKNKAKKKAAEGSGAGGVA